MRSRTETRRRGAIASLALLLAVLALVRPAMAVEPSVATLDADARAVGNRKGIAERIGDTLFVRRWPAQVLKVSADGIDDTVVVGLLLSGVKFSQPLSRAQFIDEIETLVGTVFAADRRIAEVDVWAAVPIGVTKGEIVSGDLAQPTSRTVFSASVLRGESGSAFAQRLRAGRGIYWDEDWARTLGNHRS